MVVGYGATDNPEEVGPNPDADRVHPATEMSCLLPRRTTLGRRKWAR